MVFFLQLKCRSTLRISGLVPSAYWCGLAAVDIPFYYLILSCMTIILFSLHTENLLVSSNLTAVVGTCLWTPPNKYRLSVKTPFLTMCPPCHFLSGPVHRRLRSIDDPLHLRGVVWLRPSPEQQGFLLRHLHDGEKTAASLRSHEANPAELGRRPERALTSLQVCVVSALLAQLSFVHNVLCLFNPLYPLMGCLNCITKVGLAPVSGRVAPRSVVQLPVWNLPLALRSPDFGFSRSAGELPALRGRGDRLLEKPADCGYIRTYLPTQRAPWCVCSALTACLCVQPYLQCILLLFLLRWLEMRYGGRTMKSDQLCR